MTANKHFKRRVRERARRTGESYTSALRHLRRTEAREHEMQWQWRRIEKAEYGYAVHIPERWSERPPVLKNSPAETARFVDAADRRHSATVFRGMPRPGRMVMEVAEQVQAVLEGEGYRDFLLAEAQVGGLPGARLDCAKYDAGRVWAVREYFLVHGDIRFVLACGSAVPEEDDELFEAMADRFEVLDSP
jgi:hypothetical protein